MLLPSTFYCCGYNFFNIDAVRVREEHRIVGTLVGCLPRLPRQNVQLGLPLLLSVYEARLLLEKGCYLPIVFLMLRYNKIFCIGLVSFDTVPAH